MPAYARREIVDRSQVGAYHCIARCVRRAFLCGEDPHTKRNFDHRKDWIRDRLEELAGAFAVDVLGFAVMDNHLHVMLRNRPDVAASYADEEVARRWRSVFSKRRDRKGAAEEYDELALAALLSDAEALAERRKRLANISWFMRALCEPIALRANAEDRVTGRFWEGRFKCQALLDEAALLACSMYVDLNLIRAGVADTPETSQHTGAFERIAARLEAAAAESKLSEKELGCQPTCCEAQPVPRRRDDWLSPIPESDARHGSEPAKSTRRASDRGFLPLSLDDYLALLDWTGRQLRAGKRGAIPAHLQPILERLSINAGGWVETLCHLGRRFHRVIGRAESLAARARARACGHSWYQGETAARLAFT